MKKIISLAVALAMVLSVVPFGAALAAADDGEMIVLFDIAQQDITADDGSETALSNYGWTASGDATQGSQSNLRLSLHWTNDGEIKGSDKKALTVFDGANDSTDRTVVASVDSANATAGSEKLVFEYSWGMRSDKTDNYQSWSFLDLDGNVIAQTYIDAGTATNENGGNAQFRLGTDSETYYYVVSQGSGSRDKVLALRAVPFRVEAVKQSDDGTYIVTYSYDDDGDGVYTELYSENVGVINGFKSVSTWIGGWSNQWAAMGLMDLKISYAVDSAAEVTVKTVLSDGTDSNIADVVKTVQAGVVYEQAAPNNTILNVGGVYYIYNDEASTRTITPAAGGENVITLVYDKFEGTGLTGSVISEEGATCWFADPRSLTVKNEELGIDKTYIGYIDVHGAVKAAQYDNVTKQVDEVLIRSNFQPDDHNNPTFLELPDGRIMIFYSRHTDEACFYYRISKEPGDITTLGEEKYLGTANNTTYPSPFILSDDPDHIYLCWRGIGWHPTIAQLSMPTDENDYTTEFTWGPYQMVQGGSRPYAKYTSNGKDKIYFAYTYDHPQNTLNNWLYLSVVDINSKQLQSIDGTFLSNISDGPLRITNSGTGSDSFVIEKTTLRDWVWESTVDEEGNVYVAMVTISSGQTSHDYKYAIYNASEGKWNIVDLPDDPATNTQFHPSNTEHCYSGGMTIDKNNPHIIYASVPVEGVFGKVWEIVKWTLNDDYTAVIDEEYITENSKENNVRPYIANGGADSDDIRLTWMNGQYYFWIVITGYPQGFPTRMMTLNPIPEPEIVNTLDEADGGLYAIDGNTETIAVPSSDSFTISMELLQSDISVGGTLFRSGNLEIDLEKSTVDPKYDYAAVAPKLTVGDKTAKSDNLFSNSDIYKTVSNQTDGGKRVNSMGWINYTVTYDAASKRLVTYVNGLIDANLQDVEVTLGEAAEIGGINGVITNVRTADVALTQAEVKAAAEEFNSDSVNVLESISLGNTENITADLILPSTTFDGQAIEWSSDTEAVITNTGAVIRDGEPHTVVLTAKQGDNEKEFTVTVAAKQNVTENLLFKYDFSEIYTDENGITRVKDASGNGLDAEVKGTAAKLDEGKLDLTANTAAGWDTNGYLNVPYDFLSGVRSYTIIQKVQAGNSTHPRFYDFGSNSQNSVFTRVDVFTAGVKNGTTQTMDANASVSSEKEQWVVTSYDAATGITTIYLDGEVVASGNSITYEAYTAAGSTDRNYIGRTQWWDYGSYASDNQDYNGTIDDFMFFNAALTEAEIAELTADQPDVPGEFSFTFDGTTAKAENANGDYVILVAQYDENDNLLEVKSEANSSVTVVKAENAAYAKAFIWDGLETLKPLAKAIKKVYAEN